MRRWGLTFLLGALNDRPLLAQPFPVLLPGKGHYLTIWGAGMDVVSVIALFALIAAVTASIAALVVTVMKPFDGLSGRAFASACIAATEGFVGVGGAFKPLMTELDGQPRGARCSPAKSS